MADGTTLNSQSGGDKIDTEDLGARGKVQRTKIINGDIDVDGGDITTTNPLPVSVPPGGDAANGVLGILTKAGVISSSYAHLMYHPMTQVTKSLIKSAPATVTAVYITNNNAALRYMQLHNKITAPAATDVPRISIPIPAGSGTVPGVLKLTKDDWGDMSYFSIGLGIAISTTYGTFTDSATASEHVVLVLYD